MKATSYLNRCAILLGLTAAAALPAADQEITSEPRVTVVFEHPEKYADLKDNGFDPDNARGQERYLPLIKEYVEKEAERLLAPGHRLTITFTDIDLAGEFEQWRGPDLDKVRMVKGIYVPRLVFTFRVTDDGGRVISEGERRLVDLGYQMRVTGAFHDDPLKYEKDMLRDWLREELKSRGA